MLLTSRAKISASSNLKLEHDRHRDGAVHRWPLYPERRHEAYTALLSRRHPAPPGWSQYWRYLAAGGRTHHPLNGVTALYGKFTTRVDYAKRTYMYRCCRWQCQFLIQTPKVQPLSRRRRACRATWSSRSGSAVAAARSQRDCRDRRCARRERRATGRAPPGSRSRCCGPARRFTSRRG